MSHRIAKCLAPFRSNFHGHLISASADSPGTDFQDRFDILHGLLEQPKRIFVRSSWP